MSEKIAQFKEGVTLFPDDPVARFAAHRGFGRALEKAHRLDEAKAAYQRGIEVAVRTGDLQTKKEMEVFLKRLGQRSRA